jgi:hypothetical protein
MTYASVVSCESVRILLTIAALNVLQVKCGDTYLECLYHRPFTEKLWTAHGPEFGSEAGNTAIIVCALYGLKSSGSAFRKHLGDCMRSLQYTPCLANPDLWLKLESRPDGSKYYSYILCYVDDIIVVHDDPMPILSRIGQFMKFKEGSIGDHDIYIGVRLSEVQLDNDIWCWALSPSKYVQEAVWNCSKHLKSNYDGQYELCKNAPNPFALAYDPWLDIMPLCSPVEASHFQSIIGIMR